MANSIPRRVVITGLGLVSPLGSTVESVWDGLTSGRTGIDYLKSLPFGTLPLRWGAEVREFTGQVEDFGPLEKDQMRSIRKSVKVMCREIQMGVAAAQRALHHAGLKPGDYDADRTGVVFGSDYILSDPCEFVDAIASCLDEHRRFDFRQWVEHGMPKITPLWLLKYLPNMPASHIAIFNDLRGPSNSVTMREVSANLAIGEACQLIARGSADTMVAGATGTRVHPVKTLHVLLQEEVATEGDEPGRVCRPFDLNRSGMVLGEGAGAIVLESLETAQRRGATILAEVTGSGSSAVVDRRGIGDTRAAVRNALQQALRGARIPPEEVGHIHAHGASTRRSDALEAQGIHDVFSVRRTPVPVAATKGYFANSGASGGAIELIASVLALRNQQLFPVLNYESPDPECPVDVVRSADVHPGNSFINLNVTHQGHASTVCVQLLDSIPGVDGSPAVPAV